MDPQSSSSASKQRDDSSSSKQGLASSASNLLSSLTGNNSSSSPSSSASASFLKNTLSDLVNSSDKAQTAGPSLSWQGSSWAESSSSGSRSIARGPDVSSFRSDNGATAGGDASFDVESSFQEFRTSSFSELFSPQLSNVTSPSIHSRSIDCEEAALRDGEDVFRLLNDPDVELMSISDLFAASSLLSEDYEVSTVSDLLLKDSYAEEVTEDPVEWLALTGEGGEYTEMVWGNKPARRKVGDPDQGEEQEADQELEEAARPPTPPPRIDVKGKGKAVERGRVYMKSRI